MEKIIHCHFLSRNHQVTHTWEECWSEYRTSALVFAGTGNELLPRTWDDPLVTGTSAEREVLLPSSNLMSFDGRVKGSEKLLVLSTPKGIFEYLLLLLAQSSRTLEDLSPSLLSNCETTDVVEGPGCLINKVRYFIWKYNHIKKIEVITS